MSNGDTILTPKTGPKPELERPKLYKIILVNDDRTPGEFVVPVLKPSSAGMRMRAAG